MSVRHLLTAASAALVAVFWFAAPAAAHASGEPAVAADFAMSSGRLGSTVAAVLGLIGVVAGGLALARRAGRVGAVVALATGLTGMALGAVVVATSDSGIGTGNGRGGAYVALLVGLVALLLGGLALARSRRIAG